MCCQGHDENDGVRLLRVSGRTRMTTLVTMGLPEQYTSYVNKCKCIPYARCGPVFFADACYR